MIYNKQGYSDFIQFVKQFEPTESNRTQSQTFMMMTVMKMLLQIHLLLRRRFDFPEQQYALDNKSSKKYATNGSIEGFYKNNSTEEGTCRYNRYISSDVKDLFNMSMKKKNNIWIYLAKDMVKHILVLKLTNMKKFPNIPDDIIKDETNNRTVHLQDFVTDTIRECLGAYYRNKERYFIINLMKLKILSKQIQDLLIL